MEYRLRVREVRLRKNVSLRKLHMETKIPIGTIRKLDRAPEGYYPSMLTLLKIAEVLDASLDDLYEKVAKDDNKQDIDKAE